MERSIVTVTETKVFIQVQSSPSFTPQWESCFRLPSSSSLLSSNHAEEDDKKESNPLNKNDSYTFSENGEKAHEDLKLVRPLRSRESIVSMDPSFVGGDTSSWRASSTISTLTDVLDDEDDDKSSHNLASDESNNAFQPWSITCDAKKSESKKLPVIMEPNECHQFVSSDTSSSFPNRPPMRVKSLRLPGIRRIAALFWQHGRKHKETKTKKRHKNYQSGRYYPLKI
jgi:hypothetical protein